MGHRSRRDRHRRRLGAENKKSGGILIDIDSNEIVARNLSMAPIRRAGTPARLWLLESGTGSLGTVDVNTGKYEPIVRLDGFHPRPRNDRQPRLQSASRRSRENRHLQRHPNHRATLQENRAHLRCLGRRHPARARVVAFLKFEEAVQEIFAVALLPGVRFPDLINDNAELVGSSFVLPDDAPARRPPSDLRAHT